MINQFRMWGEELGKKLKEEENWRPKWLTFHCCSLFFARFLKKHSTNSEKRAKYMLNPHQTEQTRSKRVSLWPRNSGKEAKEMFQFSSNSPSSRTLLLLFGLYVCSKPNPCVNFMNCKVLSACCVNWRYPQREREFETKTAHNQFHSIDLTESNFVRDLPARVPLSITIYVHSEMYHSVSWCCAAVSSTRWDWNFQK